MEDWEQRSLDAFRAIAKEVRGNSIVANSLTIKHWIVPSDSGGIDKLSIELLPDEAFRSLCVSVRNVYMQNGPASFFKVHKIVGHYGDATVRQQATKVRDAYQLVLRGEGMECRVRDKVVSHEQ